MKGAKLKTMDWSYTVKEYVRLEEEAVNVKHELVNGDIRAMAGGTLEHARIAARLSNIVGSQLHGSACNVYSSDARVRVPGTAIITYPDLAVTCGDPEVDTEDRCAQLNPRVLFEVTSDSSEGYDRGKKFVYYQAIPSLREYVIVSHRERLIEVFRRGIDGTWALAERAASGGGVALSSIGCALDVDDVYRSNRDSDS